MGNRPSSVPPAVVVPVIGNRFGDEGDTGYKYELPVRLKV